ncbi:MAG: hypothetical protein ACRD29_12780 [Acidimicrobiales bacterium]
MRLDTTINGLATGQHGLVATWQLRALGATETEIIRLRRRDDWGAVSSRVLGRTGVAESERRRLMAAVLDASPGAVVSNETAADLWGVPGYRLDSIQVSRHRGIARRRSSLATVHEVVDLMPNHIKIVNGIPVASPARVICELAATQHPARVERNLDWMWKEGLLDGRTFRRTVADLAGRGRKGSPLIRELDAARGPGYVPPASALERRFEEVLVRYGQKPMRRQIDSGDDAEWCGRLDFRDVDLPLGAEIQSEKHHTSLVDQAADAARRARLEAAGLMILEFWDTQVWHEPQWVAEQVRLARREL